MRKMETTIKGFFSNFVVAALVIALFVGVIGFSIWSVYKESGPVTGNIISTTYDPKHKVTTMVGKVMVTNYEEAWFAEIDTDGDMESDRTIVINEDDFNHLEDGDSFTR